MPVVAFCIRSVVDYAEVLAFDCLGNLPYLAGKIDASGIVVRGGDDRTPIHRYEERTPCPKKSKIREKIRKKRP